MEKKILSRDMIDCEAKAISKLSQGGIFNFAYDEDYLDHEILGLIITARCDLANDKTQKYSYLPIIPYDIWKDKGLIEILVKTKHKAICNDIEKSLESLNMSKNSINIYGSEKIISFIENDNSKIKGKIKKLSTLTDKVTALRFLENGGSYNDIYNIFKKDIENILKNIIENKNSEYFFIDDIKNYGACLVSLRDISHLDKYVTREINKGIDFDTIEKSQKVKLKSINTKFKNEIASIVGTVKSPYIELIMQRFSSLYTRIGVKDPDSFLFETICKP